ncbi:MAG: NAD-dependent epimerase [Candidatus Delongbacteria bacterium]|nr:NAD-dependent epimerase [Candidatus Delongbacteria bacterium]MCG2760127.1 NAD-dependent epimerase [Candidatus Delongbacteria bacterium]
MKILITGTAGFIGFHLSVRLIAEGYDVYGLDSINDYYDVNVKFGRLNLSGIDSEKIEYGKPIKSKKYDNYSFVKLNLEDKENLEKLFKSEKFDVVCNLAAQAGVRYSLTNPEAYINSNIIGFMNILEASRHNNIKHLVYASSSSVYGMNESYPFSIHHNVDHPVSLYAASKKSNELMAHCYSHLYNIPSTGLRFFTVYGPWGRPDMALFLFTKAIIEGKPIDVFNNGNMRRDFTYIDDIVEGLARVIKNPAKSNSNWTGKDPDPGTSTAPYRIYNIGSNRPVLLMDFIGTIEKYLGVEAKKNFLPLQQGDVPASHADVQDLINDFGYSPQTSIEQGIKKFLEWYIDFYKIKIKLREIDGRL